MASKFWNDLPNFKPHEFGPQGDKMNEQFMRKLQMLRNLYRKPMVITSGYRDAEHHKAIYKKIGKEPPMGSMHLQGRAADIAVSGKDAYKLIALAMVVGFKGIGVSQKKGNKRFIHLDDREEETIWSY